MDEINTRRYGWKAVPPEVATLLQRFVITFCQEAARGVAMNPVILVDSEHADTLMFHMGAVMAMQMCELDPEFMHWLYSQAELLDDPHCQNAARFAVESLKRVVEDIPS